MDLECTDATKVWSRPICIVLLAVRGSGLLDIKTMETAFEQEVQDLSKAHEEKVKTLKARCRPRVEDLQNARRTCGLVCSARCICAWPFLWMLSRLALQLVNSEAASSTPHEESDSENTGNLNEVRIEEVHINTLFAQDQCDSKYSAFNIW